jgi:hypothetical protein
MFVKPISLPMRRILPWWQLLACLLLCPCAQAGSGRVIKVLPHLLDQQGRHSLTPSLYDRDAYQFFLREHPVQRSGIRFDVQWKAKGPLFEPLTIRVELRGIAHGNLPQQLTIDQPVELGGWFAKWSGVLLTGENYKTFGDVTAWRVTLWEGSQMLGEQKSFLW